MVNEGVLEDEGYNTRGGITQGKNQVCGPGNRKMSEHVPERKRGCDRRKRAVSPINPSGYCRQNRTQLF